MNASNDKKVNARDVISLSFVVLLTVAAFWATYRYDFSTPIQVMIWIGWLVSVIILGYFTTKGKQVYQFALEAKVELLKVVWPTRQETMQTTTIVMVMVAATGVVLWAVDSVMMWAIARITHLG